MATRKPPKTSGRAIAADNPNSTPVMVRMEASLLEALDTWVAKLNAGNAGPKWSRSDVMRAVLARAVKERGEKGEAP